MVDRAELGLGSVLEFHTRSDHQARDTLYDVDNLLRFYHAQTRDPRAENLESYIRWQALGEAIRSPVPRVVLIDEIDKAPRDFPNDLLDEIDRMEFRVPELGLELHRPRTGRSSSSPATASGSCRIRSCDAASFIASSSRPATALQAILRERLGHLELAAASHRGRDRAIRTGASDAGLEKKPSTAELIAWVRVLHASGIDPEALAKMRDGRAAVCRGARQVGTGHRAARAGARLTFA